MVGSNTLDEALPVTGDRGAGVPLTTFERRRLDFSVAPVVHARWAKAAAYAFDVGDWLAHYDQTLTIGELVECFADASSDPKHGKTLREVPNTILGAPSPYHADTR